MYGACERKRVYVCAQFIGYPTIKALYKTKQIHTCSCKVYLLCWWTVFYDIPFMEDEGLKMTKLSVISFASSGIRPLRKSVTSFTVFRIRGCSICRLRWYINILYISFLHTNFLKNIFFNLLFLFLSFTSSTFKNGLSMGWIKKMI